jgi:hypothetical protein
LEQYEIVRSEFERGARCVTVTARRIEIERVPYRQCGESAVLELHSRVVVDGDVETVRTMRRNAFGRGEASSLPREVVMVERDRPVVCGEHFRRER